MSMGFELKAQVDDVDNQQNLCGEQEQQRQMAKTYHTCASTNLKSFAICDNGVVE
jgi:hypothetical protein